MDRTADAAAAWRMEHAAVGVDSACQTRAVHGISPGPESQRCGEAQSHIVFHLHSGYLAEHHRRDVRRRGRIRVTPAGLACQRLTHGYIIGGSDRTILGGILHRLPYAVHVHRICAADSRRHREHLPERDFGLPRVFQREILRRQIVRVEDLFIQSVGNERRLLAQHDAHRYAGEGFATGRQLG